MGTIGLVVGEKRGRSVGMAPPLGKKLSFLYHSMFLPEGQESKLQGGGDRRGMAELERSVGSGNGWQPSAIRSRSRGPVVMAAPKSWGRGAGRRGEKVHTSRASLVGQGVESSSFGNSWLAVNMRNMAGHNMGTTGLVLGEKPENAL